MGLVAHGAITLSDFTDVRQADLFILSSLTTTQVYDRTSNTYEPDYSSEKNGQVLTPHLYFGQEKFTFPDQKDGVPEKDKPLFSVKYSWGSNSISINEYKEIVRSEGLDEAFSIDKQYNLCFKKNLSDGEELIYCSILNAKDKNGVLYNEVISSISLNRLDSSSYYNLVLNYSRNFFSSINDEDIIITAKVMEGINQLNSGVTYYWYSSESNEKLHSDTESNKVRINRSLIQGSELITCYALINRTLEENKDIITQLKSYAISQSVLITDQTDPFELEVTSSAPSIFKETTETIFFSTSFFNSKAPIENSSSAKYNWSYMILDENDHANETSFTILNSTQKLNETSYYPITTSTLVLDFSKTEIFEEEDGVYDSVNFSQLQEIKKKLGSKGALLIQCTAEINGIKANNIARIPIVPQFKVALSPKTFFISVDENGNYDGAQPFEQRIDFFLTGPNGELLGKKSGDKIDFESSEDIFEYFSIEGAVDKPDDSGENSEIVTWSGFHFNIGLKENTSLSDIPDSGILPVFYIYNGVKYSEEIYYVKNKKGAQGPQGQKGDPGESENLILRSRFFEVGQSFQEGEKTIISQTDYWTNDDNKVHVTGKIDYAYIDNVIIPENVEITKEDDGSIIEIETIQMISAPILYNEKLKDNKLSLSWEMINLTEVDKNNLFKENEFINFDIIYDMNEDGTTKDTINQEKTIELIITNLEEKVPDKSSEYYDLIRNYSLTKEALFGSLFGEEALDRFKGFIYDFLIIFTKLLYACGSVPMHLCGKIYIVNFK